MVFASRTTDRHQMHCCSKMVVNYLRRMYRVCFLFLYYGKINYRIFNFRLSIDSKTIFYRGLSTSTLVAWYLLAQYSLFSAQFHKIPILQLQGTETFFLNTETRTTDSQWRLMWQTKYASAVPKNLWVGVDFWPCSESNFLTGRL